MNNPHLTGECGIAAAHSDEDHTQRIHVILLDGDVVTGVLLEDGKLEAFRAQLIARYTRRVQLVSLGAIDTPGEALQRLVDQEAL